jgi:hypothetical protein
VSRHDTLALHLAGVERFARRLVTRAGYTRTLPTTRLKPGEFYVLMEPRLNPASGEIPSDIVMCVPGDEHGGDGFQVLVKVVVANVAATSSWRCLAYAVEAAGADIPLLQILVGEGSRRSLAARFPAIQMALAERYAATNVISMVVSETQVFSDEWAEMLARRQFIL